MGLAIGRMRMSYDDFCRCTPEEFKAVCDGDISLMRHQWEMTRLLGAICIQPYSKTKVDPKKLLPFPWDSKEDRGQIPRQTAPRLTKEERLKRFNELVNRLDGFEQHHIDNLQT